VEGKNGGKRPTRRTLSANRGQQPSRTGLLRALTALACQRGSVQGRLEPPWAPLPQPCPCPWLLLGWQCAVPLMSLLVAVAAVAGVGQEHGETEAGTRQPAARLAPYSGVGAGREARGGLVEGGGQPQRAGVGRAGVLECWSWSAGEVAGQVRILGPGGPST